MYDVLDYPISAQTLTAQFTSSTIDGIVPYGGPIRGAQYDGYCNSGGTTPNLTNIGTVGATITITWQEADNTAFTGASLHVVNTYVGMTIGPTATIQAATPFRLVGRMQQEYSQFIVGMANGSGVTVSINGLNVIRATGGFP